MYASNYLKALATLLTLNAHFAMGQNQDPSQVSAPPGGDVPATAWSPPWYPARKFSLAVLISS